MNNIDQFIDYLLGKAEFPYFKDLPEVPLPRIYQEDPADLAHELEVEHALEAQYYADQAKTEQEDSLEIQNEAEMYMTERENEVDKHGALDRQSL